MCHVYGTLVERGNISNIKVVMELVGKFLFWIYILVEFVSGKYSNAFIFCCLMCVFSHFATLAYAVTCLSNLLKQNL